jgi:hypothetical protein
MLIAAFITLGKEIQKAAETVALGNGIFLNLNEQVKQLLELKLSAEIAQKDIILDLYEYLVEITAFIRK